MSPREDPSRIARAKALATRLRNARIGRAATRYFEFGGTVLAGGIAYTALISLAAGAVLVATLGALVVSGHPALREAILDFVSNAVPGLVGDTNGDGQIDSGLLPDSSVALTTATGIVSLIALLVLLYTASRYVTALRGGTQLMLGTDKSSAVRGKLRDLAGLGLLVVMAIIAAVAQLAAASIVAWLGARGEQRDLLVNSAAVVIALAADAVFVLLVYKGLGRTRRPWREVLVLTGVVAGLIGLMRFGSTLLLGSAASNPVLAPFAAVVTVLVWVDLLSRLVLFGGAWLGAGDPSRVPQGGRAAREPEPAPKTRRSSARA